MRVFVVHLVVDTRTHVFAELVDDGIGVFDSSGVAACQYRPKGVAATGQEGVEQLVGGEIGELACLWHQYRSITDRTRRRCTGDGAISLGESRANLHRRACHLAGHPDCQEQGHQVVPRFVFLAFVLRIQQHLVVEVFPERQHVAVRCVASCVDTTKSYFALGVKTNPSLG